MHLLHFLPSTLHHRIQQGIRLVFCLEETTARRNPRARNHSQPVAPRARFDSGGGWFWTPRIFGIWQAHEASGGSVVTSGPCTTARWCDDRETMSRRHPILAVVGTLLLIPSLVHAAVPSALWLEPSLNWHVWLNLLTRIRRLIVA